MAETKKDNQIWNTSDISAYAKGILQRDKKVAQALATTSKPYTTYGLVHLATQLNNHYNAWNNVYQRTQHAISAKKNTYQASETVVRSGQFTKNVNSLENSEKTPSQFKKSLNSLNKLSLKYIQNKQSLQYDHSNSQIWDANQIGKFYNQQGAITTDMNKAKNLFHMSDVARKSISNPHSTPMTAYAGAVQSGAFRNRYNKLIQDKNVKPADRNQILLKQSKKDAIYEQGVQHAQQKVASKDLFQSLFKRPVTKDDKQTLKYFQSTGRASYFTNNQNAQKANTYKQYMQADLSQMSPKTRDYVQQASKAMTSDQFNTAGLIASKTIAKYGYKKRDYKTKYSRNQPHSFHRSFSHRASKWTHRTSYHHRRFESRSNYPSHKTYANRKKNYRRKFYNHQSFSR